MCRGWCVGALVRCSVWGWWMGIPGGRFPALRGASGVRRCPSPGRPSSGAGSQGSATRVSRVRSMRACGPCTGPTACALAGRRCSLWGWRKGVPGGGAFHRCGGRLVSGAVPSPTARPLKRAARVPRPACPGCGRCGRVDPAPVPQRAPLRAGVARCGGGGRASPGGGALHRCEGRPVSGAVPPLAVRPPERAARVPRPVCPGCGRCGRGDSAPAPQRAPLRAAVARCGGGGRTSPGGPPSTIVRGVWCQALSRVRSPQHRSSVLCERGRPRGGCFPSRPVSGAVPPLAARPLERAAGVPRPVCPGCGRCGRGDPAPAPQRVPLRSGVARCGGGGRASPRGGASHRCEGPLRAGVARCGGGGRASPGGVLSMRCEGRPVSGAVPPRAGCFPPLSPGQALSLPRGQPPGFRVPCVPGAVGAGVGTQHRPHNVCPCGPALHAVGAAEGRPRGGCLPPL